MALAEVKRCAGKNHSAQKTFGDNSQTIDGKKKNSLLLSAARLLMKSVIYLV